MKARLQRHIAIRRVISSKKVNGQEQLLQILKNEGFEMTQATLSRDLKSLKIFKSPDPHGGYIYVLTKDQVVEQNEQVGRVNYLADGFLSIDFSGNLAVVKTKPAYASSIAAIIDSANSFEIIGTIAGDDTIFLVLRQGVEQTDVVVFLERILPNLKGRLI